MHIPWHDHIRRDAIRRHFFGQRARKTNQTSFGSPIGRVARPAYQPDDRGDVDNTPTTALDHVWDDMLAAVVRALQTRVDYRVPLALWQPVHAPATMQRGIVHQHVDLSKAIQNLCDHALHLRRDCHIGLHR